MIRRMQKLVDTVLESQRFFEDYARQKENDADKYNEKEAPPVFNKRLFIASGSVVITSEARRIMAGNALETPESKPGKLTKSEVMVMRSVVDGLKLIHKGHDYIKDALSHVITFETYKPFQSIKKRPHETCLSCYFIVQGAVEVTYDMKMSGTRSVYQPNIIYNHGTGEFLGLVSSEGLSEDLSPPGTIYTNETCVFLRIDREKFHKMVAQYSQAFDEEKRAFMTSSNCVLSQLPEETKEKILDKIYKQEIPPNRQVLRQGESSDYIFFVYSGRLLLYRDVYIPEAEQMSTFLLTTAERGGFFGEECILDGQAGSCTSVTATNTVIFKLHKSAFKVVSKDLLQRVVLQNRHDYPDDEKLRERGYNAHRWNDFKHSAIRGLLTERGSLQYLRTGERGAVHTRPPTACERNKENMYRFLAKGAQYEPLRARQMSKGSASGIIPSSRATFRPRTAIGLRHSTRTSTRFGVTKDSEERDDDDSDSTNGSFTHMPSDMARVLAKHVGKQLSKEKIQQLLKEGDCKELLKLFDESSEIGRQLRLAMDGPCGQDGFTKTTVLMTMTTDDIVRKAKELAETKRENRTNDFNDDVIEWNTVLHDENKHAREQIAADRFRVAHLRRKIRASEKRRESLRAAKQNLEHKESQSQPKKFAFDESVDSHQSRKSEQSQLWTRPDQNTVGLEVRVPVGDISGRYRKTSDNSQETASDRRREDFAENQTKVSRERPSSAPMYLMYPPRSTNISITPKQDVPIKFSPKKSTPRGRGPALLSRNQVKPPMIVSRMNSSRTQTSADTRPSHTVNRPRPVRS